MSEPTSLSHRHQFPAEIISHCVWLSYRLPLSFREIEEVMAMRSVLLSYEMMRRWRLTFGQTYANALRRRRPRPGDTWHLDEVFLKINGETHYLWRAVDQDGNVRDILVQRKRNAAAAKRFFRGVAHREIILSTEHRRSTYLNNRAENAHRPTRQKERAMKGFTSPEHAQRFLSAFSGISPPLASPPSSSDSLSLSRGDGKAFRDMARGSTAVASTLSRRGSTTGVTSPITSQKMRHTR